MGLVVAGMLLKFQFQSIGFNQLAKRAYRDENVVRKASVCQISLFLCVRHLLSVQIYFFQIYQNISNQNSESF